MKALAIFFFSLLCISSYAENLKIGFIDTNIVVTSLTQYKENIDSISREFEPKKQELLDLFNHIELLRTNIESTKTSSPSKPLNEELTNLAKLELNFKKETEFWQKTMNNKKLILLKNIEMIVNQAINEYASQEEYDLILYENVAFVSNFKCPSKIHLNTQRLEVRHHSNATKVFYMCSSLFQLAQRSRDFSQVYQKAEQIHKMTTSFIQDNFERYL